MRTRSMKNMSFHLQRWEIVRITCTLCKMLYIGETGRRLADRFREHLRDVKKDVDESL